MLQSLTVFVKKLYRRCLEGFQICNNCSYNQLQKIYIERNIKLFLPQILMVWNKTDTSFNLVNFQRTKQGHDTTQETRVLFLLSISFPEYKFYVSRHFGNQLCCCYLYNIFTHIKDAGLTLIMDTTLGFCLHDLQSFSEQLIYCTHYTPPGEYQRGMFH